MSLQKELLFKNLTEIADALVAQFGSYCEVVIHDLSRPDNSIVHIAGDVTGRHIGGPMTDFVLGLLEKDQHPADVVGYIAHTRDNRTLRSSTIFIRDKDGVPLGVFCINFDVAPLLSASEELAKLATATTSLEVDKSFSADVPNLLQDMIQKSLQHVLNSNELMDGNGNVTAKERRLIIADLESQGAFRIRKATTIIADLFNVSRYTIYKDRNALEESE